MRNIYKLIQMSFLYIWHFSQHCPTHHVTFCRGLFQICTNYSFSSSLFSFRFIINWFQSFINAYKLRFVLVHNIYVAHKNVELVPVLSLIFCYLFRFLENRAKSGVSVGFLNLSLINTAPKQSWWASWTSL